MGVYIKKKQKPRVIQQLDKSEVFIGPKPIPIKIIIKVMKSICKIAIKIKKGKALYGTGFFLNYSEQKKYLMTCYHVINPSLENENIIIEIHNSKTMKLKFKNRFTKYLEKPKDIAMIEIKKSDEIYEDIEFLNYDYNYIKQGYLNYEDADIFSIEHPLGGDASCASGKIEKINDYEFDHSIPTEKGSSGCPIILLTNNIKLIQVIGIHKEGDYANKVNIGTFIGEILNEESLNNLNDNYIIAEINIEEKDVNKNIRIINSYDECMRLFPDSPKFRKDDRYRNEDEIKKCEIRINEELIPFNYEHKFNEKGKYIIKYLFKKNINNICLLFYRCSSLTKINLSNFNTNNLSNINGLFSGCSSLININLSNFNTNNVTDMTCLFRRCSSLTNIDLSNFKTNNFDGMYRMFSECSSLTNIDLSNFNTNNVIQMGCMFEGCSSLTNIDLSNFNTNNVIDMVGMFCRCSSLTNINLSNFKTNKVTNMEGMFSECSSLTNIDLSNFNTNKVNDMVGMFCKCSSITNINLSNFNINNATSMEGMFYGCKYLKNENIIIKNKKLFNHNEIYNEVHIEYL